MGRFAQNHSKIDSKIIQNGDGFSVRFSRNFEERSDDQRIKWLLRSKSFKNRFQKSLKLMIDFSLDFREILRA